MASCSSDTGNLRKDEEEEEEGRLKVMSNNPDYELLSYSACIPSEPLQEETPIGEYKYHAVEDHDNRAAALQRVLLERRALSRDMVRLQDSLMAKTQENLLLRGKLGISELELDRKEDIIRECIEQIRKLHADNNRLLCVVQANGLDIGGGGGGNKHHRSMVSSPATTTASIESECVIPQSKPMSAEEEYFRMVVLAVKLNSTYLDNLGLFDPKDLYGRACEEKVPFHQWHRWVESQMIRGVYRPLAGSAPGVDSEEVGRKSTQDDDHLQQAGTAPSGGSGFFGNRLQLPERVNGLFTSISKRVSRQSNHDMPKKGLRGGGGGRRRRRRAASLEITPRGNEFSEEDSSPGGMSRSTGKAEAVIKRNSHYRKQLSTAAAAH